MILYQKLMFQITEKSKLKSTSQQIKSNSKVVGIAQKHFDLCKSRNISTTSLTLAGLFQPLLTGNWCKWSWYMKDYPYCVMKTPIPVKL